jgi:phosphate starvation-inducible PhoH-like protein
VDLLNNEKLKIVLGIGPAGTGKTMFACLKAIDQFQQGNVEKIIITRPVVLGEDDIGFLPGNIVQKMDPWMKPIIDIFLEKYDKKELDNFFNKNIIEICPLSFMRGRTFKNAFIIADEMQNSSPNQMKMVTTRIGENSRLIITGDLQQIDIKGNNGLDDFICKLSNHPNSSELIDYVEFNVNDVERSEVVKKVLEIYGSLKGTTLKLRNPFDPSFFLCNSSYSLKHELPNPNKNINDDAALIPINHIQKLKRT